MTELFIFGMGYVAEHLALPLHQEGWTVHATSRDEGKCGDWRARGIGMQRYRAGMGQGITLPDTVTHILLCIPPSEAGDPVWQEMGAAIATLPKLAWLGYLSTTGVYGDTGGAWVDESAPLHPAEPRHRNRALAESQWLDSWRSQEMPAHIFRLAGIYGERRNNLEALENGTARRIERPGQFFSRIHVADIVTALRASMACPTPGEIFNLCDDYPSPSAEVIEYAARLMGVPPPARVAYDDPDALSDMARSFYRCSRRVSNRKMKKSLGITLAYPDYRSGLRALWDARRKEQREIHASRR